MSHVSTEQRIRACALRLGSGARDYDALLELARGRSFVQLGESSHGTREFYEMRAEISSRLVREAGFEAVALEADWPDCARLDRYVRGEAGDNQDRAFEAFQRFPLWMWRNTTMRDFASALRRTNVRRVESQRIGVFGLDLYSLYRSADALIAYLQRVDPEQAAQALSWLACIDHARDPLCYGRDAAAGLRASCAAGAREIQLQLLQTAHDGLAEDSIAARHAQFLAEGNARVMRHAETYYRRMFSGRPDSWNLRDAHMLDTLLALHAHLRAQGRTGRIVVWAHNTHVGDARATDMSARGEWSLGQLLRERVGAEHALLVGFTSYTGHVTAAPAWGEPAERYWMRPALPDSVEHLLHRSGGDRFFVVCDARLEAALDPGRLQRAIGVIYRPNSERLSHYLEAAPAAQFDALFHLDETSALEPIDSNAGWRLETSESSSSTPAPSRAADAASAAPE